MADLRQDATQIRPGVRAGTRLNGIYEIERLIAVRRHGRDLSRPRHPDRRPGGDQDDPSRARAERRRAGAVPEGSLDAAQPLPRGDRPLLRLLGRSRRRPALPRDGVRRRAVALRHPEAAARSTTMPCASCSAGSPAACKPRTTSASSTATSRPTTSSCPAATSRAPKSSTSASPARPCSARAR